MGARGPGIRIRHQARPGANPQPRELGLRVPTVDGLLQPPQADEGGGQAAVVGDVLEEDAGRLVEALVEAPESRGGKESDV